MIKLVKTVFTLLLVFTLCSAFAKKEGHKQVYVFGVSASFLDSVIYFTDVQKLDSAKLEKGLFPNWDAYSYQLKNYLEQIEGLSNRTCMVYYSDDRKKLEKEAEKLKNKYLKNKMLIKPVNSEKFRFHRAEN